MADKLIPVTCDSCHFIYRTKNSKAECEHCGEPNVRVITELQAHELMHKIFRKTMKTTTKTSKWKDIV